MSVSDITCASKTIISLLERTRLDEKYFRFQRNPEDEERLRNLTVVDKIQNDFIKLATLNCNGSIYIAIFGCYFQSVLESSFLGSVGAYNIDKIPSVLMRLIGEDVFYISKTMEPEDVRVQLGNFFDENKNIHCIPPYYIFDVFDDFFLFEVDSDSPLINLDAHQIYCTLLAQKFSNKFSIDIGDLFCKFIFEEHNSAMPWEYVEMSLMSAYPKHSFLEVYRTIEALYSIPHSISLRNEINKKCGIVKISGKELAKLCKAELSWNRKEGDSLKKLFSLVIDSELIASSAKSHYLKSKISEPKDVQSSSFSLAEAIYKIRNYHVHFISSDESEASKIDNSELNLITRFLWEVSFKAYRVLRDDIK